MDKCVICGGQEFYVDAGFYFCKECQTQHANKREELVDFYTDTNTKVKRKKIRAERSSSGGEEVTGWTSWEQYNFILIGLANELIELGASTDIKITLLQLWATYLGKLEVAFTSTSKKLIPKLSKRYNKKDAEIIYGRIAQKKKKKKSKSVGDASNASSVVSSFATLSSLKTELGNRKKKLITSEYDRYMQLQNDSDGQSMTNQSLTSNASSASDGSINSRKKIKLNKYAKIETLKVNKIAKTVPKAKRSEFKEKHVSTKYATGPQIITPSKLWALIYLALRINNDKIHLSDMLRFSREGHLSYYRLEHLLPSEIHLNKADISQLNPIKDIKHKGMRRYILDLARFLGVLQVPHPNLLSLIERYVTELQLPNGILVYAERMMAMSPPNMQFNKKSQLFPNYEGRAMAFIIVIMKLLFGLDGITEYEISRVIDRINVIGREYDELESKLFNFCEWQRYIECRRCILVKEHFPTKLRRDPLLTGSNHLYVKFIQSIQLKYEGEEPEVNKYFNLVPKDIANMMKQNIERLADSLPVDESVVVFPPSLISQHDYLKQLLDDPDKNLPSILRQAFPETKVGYMLKPESLEALAAQCNIELRIITAPAHFVEKIVQAFEPFQLPNIKQQRQSNNHNKLTRVIASNCEKIPMTKSSDDPSEYLHRKYPGKIIIDSKKRKLYNKVRNSINNHENNDGNDFEFDQVYSNGNLKISNSDDELDDDNPTTNTVNEDYNLIFSNFERQTMLCKINNPWEKKRMPRRYIHRNGKFARASEVIDSDTVSCDVQSNDLQSEIQQEVTLIDDDLYDDIVDNPIIVNEISDDEPLLCSSNSDEISILSESIESGHNSNIVNDSVSSKHETLTLFCPFKQYWLHRCANYSNIRPRYFRLLEQDLPYNFRWLLRECSYIVEMNIEDLYEEVCLIENYYIDILSPNNNLNLNKKYDTSQLRSTTYMKNTKQKWNCC